MTGTYQLASTRYFGKVLCPAMTTFRGEMHCFREEAIFSFHLLTNVQLSMNSLSQRQDITDWHCLSSMYASGSVILPRSKLETERFTEGGKKKVTLSSYILPLRTHLSLSMLAGKLLHPSSCIHIDFSSVQISFTHQTTGHNHSWKGCL